MAQADFNSGLIAYYPFNGNANDFSGNGNHGTVMGAQLTDDYYGFPGQAYLFNGSSDYITVPASASLDQPDTAMTMSAWVMLNGSSLVGQAGVDPIIMKSDDPANAFMYRMDCGPTYVSGGTGTWFNLSGTTAALDLGTWYMLTVSMSPDTNRVYIDGALVYEAAYVPQLAADGRPLEIGCDMPGMTEYFNGKIDEVRIYDRALSAEDVAALYTWSWSVGTAWTLPAGWSLRRNTPGPSRCPSPRRASMW
jgi:hypothetical protein